VNNPEDNKKKILCNVLKKGDVYFRSGDIVVMDKYGWLYFKVFSTRMWVFLLDPSFSNFIDLTVFIEDF
jgi:hypothetical protein